MAEQVRARAVISGKVQGVFFRVDCRDRASRLGLSGWVGNRPDGTVEVVVQGPEEAVRSLLAWAEAGPELARVAEVSVAWEAPDPDETTFQIR